MNWYFSKFKTHLHKIHSVTLKHKTTTQYKEPSCPKSKVFLLTKIDSYVYVFYDNLFALYIIALCLASFTLTGSLTNEIMF